MRVVVTGSDGFLGRHLRTRLRAVAPEWEMVEAPRSVFDDDASLVDAVAGADAVAHLAGVNRGDAATVEAGNVDLAERLTAALDRAGSAPRLVYADSVQAGAGTPYGRGKQRASEMLATWAKGCGAAYVDLVLPNLFGECGRPDYNSFVATFCQRLASEDAPEIRVDRDLELLHAQDAAGVIAAHLAPGGPGGAFFPSGTSTSVSEVLERLVAIADVYRTGRLPDLGDSFSLRLFNTYRSYLYPDRFPMVLAAHADERGAFVETTQALGGESQSSFSTTRRGVTRGNHFHLRKVERFVVVRGRAQIAMRPVWGGAVHTFDVSGEQPALVDMPTLYTHNITNVGEEDLYTVFWISEIYDPADADTFAMVVE